MKSDINREATSISIIALLLLFIISLTGCGERTVTRLSPETESQSYSVYLDIKSESNILFSTYDISILLDGKEVGTVKNGSYFTLATELNKGEHKIRFDKIDDSSVYGQSKFTVDQDITLKCSLKSTKSEIEVNDFNTEVGITNNTIVVPYVVNEKLDVAKTKLKELGFTNVKMNSEGDASIWEESNWIVTSQSVEKGQKVDKNTEIVLVCIKYESFLKNTFVGLTVPQAKEKAEELGISRIEFVEEGNLTDITLQILALPDEKLDEKQVMSVTDLTGDEKKIRLHINKDIGGTQTDNSETPANGTGSIPDAVKETEFYSTNTKEEAKKGNSGVYAYKSREGQYSNYWIIDFDEGYVYFFSEGNGDDSCDRVKIVSGDLNNIMKITYHEEDTSWDYFLGFRMQNYPDLLTVIDNDGFDYQYGVTDLEKALKLKENKRIIDY